jgi:hypothetical protein
MSVRTGGGGGGQGKPIGVEFPRRRTGMSRVGLSGCGRESVMTTDVSSSRNRRQVLSLIHPDELGSSRGSQSASDTHASPRSRHMIPIPQPGRMIPRTSSSTHRGRSTGTRMKPMFKLFVQIPGHLGLTLDVIPGAYQRHPSVPRMRGFVGRRHHGGRSTTVCPRSTRRIHTPSTGAVVEVRSTVIEVVTMSEIGRGSGWTAVFEGRVGGRRVGRSTDL